MALKWVFWQLQFKFWYLYLLIYMTWLFHAFTGIRSPWPADHVRCQKLLSRYSSGLATSIPRSIHWSMRTLTEIFERLSATHCCACSVTGGRIATCHSTLTYDAQVYATISVPRASTRRVISTRPRPHIADSRSLSTTYNTGTRRCWRPLHSSSSGWQRAPVAPELALRRIPYPSAV